MASLIGQTVSHYRILEQLGGGGMGIVYKAQDLKLDRPVALKFLPPDLTRDPDAKQRFVHEAKAASALQHNNICAIHDIDQTDDGQMFIVMDLYEGETLRKKIEHGPLKIDDALDIAIQIAQGLAKAHEHRIVHRDIKPANVIVTKDSVAKILDFGVAKLVGQAKVTKTGSTIGTVAYMSPEQIQRLTS
jgi:serine/threonine protein kinase